MLKRLVAILTMALAIPPLVAQEVEWSIDASTLINNREGGQDDFTPDQTFLFTRLAPEVGLSLLDGEHQLKGGVAWYQPMLDDLGGYKVLPTLYYRYNRPDGWHVTAGIFPRSLMRQRLPRYLWSDSLNYCQPNIKGIMAQLVKSNGYIESTVNWRQMQTAKQREAFTFTASTDWKVVGPFGLGGHLQYSHLAMSSNHAPDEHVNDDIIINPMAALDFSHRWVMDSLRIAAGAIIGMERDRGTERWDKPAAFVATVDARWQWIELNETFYAGQPLMPLYSRFGSKLIQGDPYYNNKIYSRTDLIFHIVNNRFVDLSASLALHASDKTTGFWQQVACRFYIDSQVWKRRHDKQYLREGRLSQHY